MLGAKCNNKTFLIKEFNYMFKNIEVIPSRYKFNTFNAKFFEGLVQFFRIFFKFGELPGRIVQQDRITGNSTRPDDYLYYLPEIEERFSIFFNECSSPAFQKIRSYLVF